MNALLEQWPWDVPSRKDSAETEESQSINIQLRKEARKFGFRCLRKAKWEELKAEYLLYRQQLVEEMNRHQDEELEMRTRKVAGLSTHRPSGAGANASALVASQKIADEVVKRPMDELLQTQTEGPKSIHSGSKYPSGCLVFVRNLHPETNKTTLRTFFSQAWNEGPHSGEPGSACADGVSGLDYLDFTKGMDRVGLSNSFFVERSNRFFSVSHPSEYTPSCATPRLLFLNSFDTTDLWFGRGWFNEFSCRYIKPSERHYPGVGAWQTRRGVLGESTGKSKKTSRGEGFEASFRVCRSWRKCCRASRGWGWKEKEKEEVALLGLLCTILLLIPLLKFKVTV